MSKLADWADDEELDFGDFYGRKELRRFLALLTLSAFAYLDSYGRLLVDYIGDYKSLETILLDYLKKNEIRDNRDDSLVETLKHVKHLGLKQRFGVLEDAFEIRTQTECYFDSDNKDEYNRYKKLFSYFIILRGKMAHKNPEPSLSKFDHKFFRRARNDIKKSFSVFPEIEGKIPEPLERHFEIIESWFNKTSSTLAIIYAVPKMIVVYTALIDAAIAHQKETTET
jgi:hypothetical protein